MNELDIARYDTQAFNYHEKEFILHDMNTMKPVSYRPLFYAALRINFRTFRLAAT